MIVFNFFYVCHKKKGCLFSVCFCVYSMEWCCSYVCRCLSVCVCVCVKVHVCVLQCGFGSEHFFLHHWPSAVRGCMLMGPPSIWEHKHGPNTRAHTCTVNDWFILKAYKGFSVVLVRNEKGSSASIFLILTFRFNRIHLVFCT